MPDTQTNKINLSILSPDPFSALLEQVRENIAAAVAGKTVEKVQSALDEAAEEPDSPLWQSFDERLRKLIGDLKASQEMGVKIRVMQDSIAGSDVVDDFASKTWFEIKAFVLADCVAGDSTGCRKITEALLSAARQLKENSSLRSELNTFFSEQVLKAILAARPHARELVVSTMQQWDAKEMADRLEGTVGSDLQFIRLNGTGVGGLVGVFIHAAFFVLGK